MTSEHITIGLLLFFALQPAYCALRELLRGYHIQRFDDYKTPQELLRGSMIIRRKKYGKERR